MGDVALAALIDEWHGGSASPREPIAGRRIVKRLPEPPPDAVIDGDDPAFDRAQEHPGCGQRAAAGIGAHDLPVAAHEKHRRTEGVDGVAQRLRLDPVHVDDVADRDRPPDVREKQQHATLGALARRALMSSEVATDVTTVPDRSTTAPTGSPPPCGLTHSR